jgi:hypothetical protein
MKPVAGQTTKAPCVHSMEVSIAQPAKSSRLAEFGGRGMSFNICRGTLGSLAMLTAKRNASSRDSASRLRLLYWKSIPSCLSVRQITLQVRVVWPGKPKRNVDGISNVAATTREAPDSVKLRTVHGSTAFFPRIIAPDLRVRRRGVFRRSAIG